MLVGHGACLQLDHMDMGDWLKSFRCDKISGRLSHGED